MAERLRCERLRPAHWPALETLFGANGACGGCWCMYWRQEKGEKWADVKGAEAKRRFRALVKSGKAHGVLAFDGDRAVGWCSVEKRTELVKLDRAPSLRCDDADRVHSLPCFFIHRDYRRQGVARALLLRAVQSLRQEGARILEGYPVRERQDGTAHPAAFAWTGTVPLFERAGFSPADDKPTGKRRMRRALRR